MRGLCLGVARPAAPFVASGASWPSSAAVIIDLEQATLMQEITGASATTPAGVGDPVGSISNVGSAGGWITALSNSYRPPLGQTGGLYYLGDAGFGSWNLLFSGIPVSDLVSLFAAIETPATISTLNIPITGDSTTGGVIGIDATGKLWSNASLGTTTLSGGTSYVIGGAGNRSGGTFRLNGADDGTYAASTGRLAGGRIGGGSSNAEAFVGDKFWGCAGFQAAPSAADVSAVEAMLALRSGVTLA